MKREELIKNLSEHFDWLCGMSNEKQENFKNADLSDVCLNNADLSSADFRQVDSTYINLRYTDPSDADIN